MYTKYFGFNKFPFEQVHDPGFYFEHGDHALVRSRIADSLKTGRGMSVLSGPAGSGKTTLSKMIRSNEVKELRLIWMAEPPANSNHLYLYIAQELGLDKTPDSALMLDNIRDALTGLYNEGGSCLLIIDEFHTIENDTLTGIRLLNKLEKDSKKLVRILLLAREEFMETINHPDMQLFKQSIASLEVIKKMSPDSTRQYITHRLRAAGGDPSIFAETGWEALMAAFQTGGTPRLINSLCDRSMARAYEKGKKRVEADDVYDAAGDMGLQDNVFDYRCRLETGEDAENIPVTDMLSGNNPVHGTIIPKEEHAGLKAHVKALITRVIGRKEGSTGEILETDDVSVINAEENRPSIHRIVVNDNKLKKTDKAAPRSEWVTMSAGAMVTFMPTRVRKKVPMIKSRTAAELVEWVRINANMSEDSKAFYIDDSSLIRNKDDSFSEWVSVDSKGEKPLSMRYVKDMESLHKYNTLGADKRRSKGNREYS